MKVRKKFNVATDGLNTRLSEEVKRLSRANDMKHAEQLSAVPQSLDAFLVKLRHRQSGLSNAVDSQHTELREVHLSGVAQLQENLGRAASNLQVRHLLDEQHEGS